MKITEKQLRRIIRESLLSEGIGDYVTSILGQAGIGDIAALVKAIALDGGRLLKNWGELGDSLSPFGIDTASGIGDLPQNEIDLLTDQIRMGSEADKLNIKEQVYDTAESMKSLSVSLISAIPDVVVSTPVALTISSMPVERFLVAGSDKIAPVIQQIKGSDTSEDEGMISSLMPDLSSITGGMGIPGMLQRDIGKIEEVTGDLPQALRYLSQIMDAASDDTMGQEMASAGMETVSNLATSAAGDTLKSAATSFLTESRMRKLAGLD